MRELLPAPRRFTELAHALPRLSRALLTRRLGQLVRAGICSRTDKAYQLTGAGRALAPVLAALGRWGLEHTPAEPSPAETNPDLLMWWWRDRFDVGALPAERTVVQVDLTDTGRRYWLVLHTGDVDVCRTDPGYEVNLTVTASTTDLLRVVQGWTPVDRAIRDGAFTLRGPSTLTRSFPRWISVPVAVSR